MKKSKIKKKNVLIDGGQTELVFKDQIDLFKNF